MNERPFLDRLLDPEDRERILGKIASIESKSSGEVQVHVSDRRVRDPLAAARKTFASLGMTRIRLRNGVLVYPSLPGNWSELAEKGLPGEPRLSCFEDRVILSLFPIQPPQCRLDLLLPEL